MLDRIPEEFVLYGGSGAALRFGHRKSRDFVFFSNSFPASKLLRVASDLPFLKKYPSGVSLSEDGRSAMIELYIKDSKALKADDNYLRVTLLSDREIVPGSVEEPDLIPDNQVKLASLMDTFVHKVWATAHRSEAGDFIDIVEFIKQGYSLETAFGVSLSYAQKAKETWNLDVKKLREDYIALASERFLPDSYESEILKEAALNVNLCRVFRRRIKMYDSLYDLKSEGPLNYFKEALGARNDRKKIMGVKDFILTHDWDYDPDLAEDPDRFLLFLLAFCPVDYYEDALSYGFTREDFIRALEKAPADLFPREADLRELRERFKFLSLSSSPAKFH
jgi:hypothetical protein